MANGIQVTHALEWLLPKNYMSLSYMLLFPLIIQVPGRRPPTPAFVTLSLARWRAKRRGTGRSGPLVMFGLLWWYILLVRGVIVVIDYPPWGSIRRPKRRGTGSSRPLIIRGLLSWWIFLTHRALGKNSPRWSCSRRAKRRGAGNSGPLIISGLLLWKILLARKVLFVMELPCWVSKWRLGASRRANGQRNRTGRCRSWWRGDLIISGLPW